LSEEKPLKEAIQGRAHQRCLHPPTHALWWTERAGENAGKRNPLLTRKKHLGLVVEKEVKIARKNWFNQDGNGTPRIQGNGTGKGKLHHQGGKIGGTKTNKKGGNQHGQKKRGRKKELRDT